MPERVDPCWFIIGARTNDSLDFAVERVEQGLQRSWRQAVRLNGHDDLIVTDTAGDVAQQSGTTPP